MEPDQFGRAAEQHAAAFGLAAVRVHVADVAAGQQLARAPAAPGSISRSRPVIGPASSPVDGPPVLTVVIDGRIQARPTGIGKSFLCCPFVEWACRRGFTARHIRMPALAARAGWPSNRVAGRGPRPLFCRGQTKSILGIVLAGRLWLLATREHR